jgi:hypothetical protein
MKIAVDPVDEQVRDALEFHSTPCIRLPSGLRANGSL